MWITVEAGPGTGPDLVLPATALGPEIPPLVTLRYGTGQTAVSVGTRALTGGGTTADRPEPVLVSPEVLRRLHIRTEPVYRLRADGESVEIGPVLGLLLGNRTNWYDDAYMQREPERVTDAYRRTGGLFCALSPRNCSVADGCAYGLFFDPREARWRYGALPVPAVIHRRSFHTSPDMVARIRGAHLFNSRRFTKWELHQLISKDPALRSHLPITMEVTEGPEVFSLLRRVTSVVLKPAHLSRGRGILFVVRDGRKFRVTDCREEGPERQSVLTKPELQTLIARELVGHRYLAQQRINLAEIEGAPFDLRVVMQRGPDGQWSEHAIECRLAGRGNLVTNIAQGGRALTLGDALAQAFGGAVDPAVAEAQALDLAGRVCRVLDSTGEHFAEWGIDLALDRSGRLWFIETNVVPTFKGFEALDPELYRRLLSAPMRYAAALAGFREEG